MRICQIDPECRGLAQLWEIEQIQRGGKDGSVTPARCLERVGSTSRLGLRNN